MRLTAIKAIDLSIEQWTMMVEEKVTHRQAHTMVCREHDTNPRGTGCFLCYVGRPNEVKPCDMCPCTLVTGVHCEKLGHNCFWGDPIMGLSVLLALRYYHRRGGIK